MSEVANTKLRIARIADINNGASGVTKMLAAYATGDEKHVELHAWAEDGGSLRDDNHAVSCVDMFADCDSGHIIKGPPIGKRVLFTVWITISKTRRATSSYHCDYHRHNGCPLNVIDAGMDLYHEFKRVIRKARDNSPKKEKKK